MKMKVVRIHVRMFMMMCAAALALATAASAWRADLGGNPGRQQSAAPASGGQDAGKANQTPAGGPAIDPQEDAAYKAFQAVSPRDSKKIQLGKQFLEKYPKGPYSASVCVQLTQIYYNAKDWDNFYSTADKALSINPNDVGILTLVGWVIPRNYRDDDPDGQKKLDKAEADEKHALELLATVPKPASLTDDQFTQAKSAALSQAHSGLGLIYFREQKAAAAAEELQQATNPDATDLFILGASYEMQDRHSDAAAAFQKCSVMPGALQDRCKQSADQAKAAAPAN